jgi:Regulator of chromosome condensation (RCC1) repeat
MRPSAVALLFLAVAASCGGRPAGGLSTDGAGRDDAGDAPDATWPPTDAPDAAAPDSSPDLDAPVDGDASPDVADAPDSADAPASDVAPARRPYKAIAIASGRYHVCALLEDHRVKCWGTNSYGWLGLGDTRERGLDPAEMGDNLPTVDLGTGRTAKAITAGRYATCALLDDASVKCWGWGPLAVGEKAPPGNIGDAPGEMGDALLPMDLGAGRTAKDVALGYYNGCVIRDDDSVICWGSSSANEEYLPFAGKRLVRLAGARGVLGVDVDGQVVVVSRGFNQTAPAALVPPRKAIAVAGSEENACAIFEGDVVSCATDFLATFPATYPSPLAGLGITRLGHACWMLKDGRVECRSANSADNPWAVAVAGRSSPSVRLGEPAVALTANGTDDLFCALLANGEVKCWSYGIARSAHGGSIATTTAWPSVDLGTRPAP